MSIATKQAAPRALRINLPTTGPEIPLSRLSEALASIGLVIVGRCRADRSYDAVHAEQVQVSMQCAASGCERYPAVRHAGQVWCGIHGAEQLRGIHGAEQLLGIHGAEQRLG